MNVSYRYAVVSWCPDLTDPDALAVPAALVLVSRDDAGLDLAVACGAQFDGTGDSLSDAFLRDISVVIRNHMDRLSAPTLEQLAASLRGTLHVSRIAPQASVEVHDEVDLVREALRLLGVEIDAFASASPDDLREGHSPAQALHSTDPLAHSIQQWQLGKMRPKLHATA